MALLSTRPLVTCFILICTSGFDLLQLRADAAVHFSIGHVHVVSNNYDDYYV